MKSSRRQSQRSSGRVLAFFALAVLPPAALSACGSLFNKDADAGADAAAVALVALDAVAPLVSADPVGSAPLASAARAPVVVVRTDAGTKKFDGGVLVDAGARVVVVDSGIPRPVPNPIPSGMKVPGLPSGFRIPSGIPSRWLPR